MASTLSALSQHRGDGTRYAAAVEWLDALTAYVNILNTEIGWTKDKSVQFVMDKYGYELDNGTAMFVQMYLQSLGG